MSPPEYRIRVAGPIGPVVAHSLPGLSITALPASTVVSGTVTDTADLLAVLNVLGAHGLCPIDTLITPPHPEPQKAEHTMTTAVDDRALRTVSSIRVATTDRDPR